MKNKIINSIFYLSIIAFIASSCFLSFSLMKKPSQAAGGLNVGGRIVAVLFSPPPPAGPIAPCSSGVLVVTITPYGGSGGSTICLPVGGIPISGSPITLSSAGGQILGLFSALIPIAAPIGFIGSSM